jgi:hypothetical protein
VESFRDCVRFGYGLGSGARVSTFLQIDDGIKQTEGAGIPHNFLPFQEMLVTSSKRHNDTILKLGWLMPARSSCQLKFKLGLNSRQSGSVRQLGLRQRDICHRQKACRWKEPDGGTSRPAWFLL